ncbi:hypothetical protein HGA92_05215 [Candidatus Gracilibacteria bacterium]|nr:hypothetical protein [Candidatus Gracilibacteria bacterium]NUJ99031.1 hypothetical protein [Candidatus Gracilibacteria bacterium]
MIRLLFRTFFVSLFALVVMFFYYVTFSFHKENFDGYFFYGIFIFLAYIGYKFYYYFKDDKKVIFTPWTLLNLFLIQLFIFCLSFFHFNTIAVGNGILLFLKILFFLILPIFLSFLFYSSGYTLLSYKKGFQEEGKIFKIFISYGIGIFLFISFLSIAGFLGFYTLWSFLIIVLLFLVFSFREFFASFKKIGNLQMVFDNHQFGSDNFIKKFQPYLLSSEFLFLIITALLSVNFINIMRPFPIGWDDLGVYMNYANQIAYTGEIFSFGQMISWQVFTGIGFLFGSSTQAFFINSFSGLLISIFLTLFIHSFLNNSKQKKTFFNIPLLVTAIYISLPMAIFHFAKDMKLDQGLFLISMIALYSLYYLFYKKEKLEKGAVFYFFLIGILLGFTFSIKLTSLLLISASFGLFFFYKLGLSGFLGFLGIFFALFTKFHLWDFMSVVYPKNDIQFVNNFSLVSFVFGLLFLGYGFKKYKNIHHFLLFFVSLLLGIIVSLIPWISYNISTIKSGNINIGTLISGEMKIFTPDYTLIHSQKHLDSLENKAVMSNEGISSNEDLGRYFGYEKGINNYVKLPWNLTMQANQRGEFTDISYIFLAFLPGLFLFLPYRKKYYHVFIYFLLLFAVFLFVLKGSSLFFSNIFSSLTLPFGYIFLFLFFVINILFFIFSLDIKNHKNLELFVFNFVFSSFYVFLWLISAFGIVWYGIIMYLTFLVSFAFGLYYLFSYDEEEEKIKLQVRFFCSFVVFFLIIFYFFNSAIPHLFINLKTAGYTEYKLGKMNENEAIFSTHPEYFDFLFEMNIDKEKQEILINSLKKELSDYISTTQYAQNILPILEKIHGAKGLEAFLGELSLYENVDINVRREAKRIRNKLYKSIVHPSLDMKSNAIIYRVGTFMKYFISDNVYRLYDDSLLFNFDKYMYDETNINTGIERIKKLGMSYILVDLNAATIDKSPDGDLTKRYEEMLKSFTSDKLELVGSDSICLMLALEDYKNSSRKEADLDEYMKYAGVNYDSMDKHGNELLRSQKLSSCYTKINNLVASGSINSTKHPYLLGIYTYLKSENNSLKTEEDYTRFYMQYIPSGYKVLFRIK